MFRLYSPFLAPVFLPEWVEDEVGGAFACYAFTARAEGALRRSKRRRMERRGRMHGRVCAVAVWTELYCPGNLSVASPRSLFLPLPPPNTVFLPHTQKTRKHTYFVHVSHNLFSLYHTLSLSPSPFCLIPLGVSPDTLLCLHFPLVSHKQTWPVPPPAHPQLLIISPHLCDCHATQTVKAKKRCNLLICTTSFISYVILS